MKVIEKGYKYLLEQSPRDANLPDLEIVFIHRADNEMVGGITNEEVIKMLQNRFRVFCSTARGDRENFQILEKLQEIEALLESIRDRNVKRKMPRKDPEFTDSAREKLDAKVRDVAKSIFGSVKSV